MRTPGGQAIDAFLHGMAEEMPAHQIRQHGDLFRRFLQQQEIGLVRPDESGDIPGLGADPAQQIPARHPQGVPRMRP